ncbi:unnamed protein product [Ceutorhynchus assimilis]|uniref:RRM domain-containing protein n=1 Tax=Ceutorhynchus assimilis TaxID=467358 RepID=A0A9N9QN47_9CUCU|nr:unnamed protein product [Ceutorhynchus assimilis]
MVKIKKEKAKKTKKVSKTTITIENPVIGASIEETNLKTPSAQTSVTSTSSGTLALDKTKQKKVARESKRIKKGIKDGSITVTVNHKEKKQKLEEGRGLIYIGHIPHGFYEEEMKNYFKQFGKVTNVKVCRSRVSGNSKGYGYVEFDHPEVAKIAADTMDNYVMFKKRVVTEYVPYEKRPKGLFHGTSSTLKHTSVRTRQGKEKHSKNKIQDSKTVIKKAKKSLGRFNAKVKKLKSLGIQCKVSPLHSNDEIISKIKVEPKSKMSLRSSANLVLNPNMKKSKSKKSLETSPSSAKALTKSKSSNKAVLAKSLDSVKTLLKNTNLVDLKEQRTQTQKLRSKTKKVAKGGITKVKKEKKPLDLNKDVLKKIARELIRVQGTPLVQTKSVRIGKKK